MLKKSFKTFDNRVIAHLERWMISGITMTWETQNHLPHRSYFDLKTSSSQPWKFILHHLSPYAWSCHESCRATITSACCTDRSCRSISMIGCGVYGNFWEERLNPPGSRVWGTNDLATGRNQLASKAAGLNRYLTLQGNIQLCIKVKKKQIN